MVDRYDPKYKSELGYEVNAWMDKDADGDWVKYENYEALEAKLAALEKYNKQWHEIADGFLGKKLDTHLGDKICIIGWKRDELITRIAALEYELAIAKSVIEAMMGRIK